MNGVKTLLQSKTIWGAGITLLGVVLRYLGYEMNDSDVSLLVEGLTKFIGNWFEVIGMLIAVYGRIKATKVIKAKK